jgi:SNF family Na+-dependent transporter
MLSADPDNDLFVRCFTVTYFELVQVAYFTATFPYIMLTVLVLRGATLSGSMDGIMYFITPSWQELTNPEVSIYIIFQNFCRFLVTIFRSISMTHKRIFASN